MRGRFAPLALALALVLAALMAGCGGGGGATTTAQRQTSAAPQSAAPAKSEARLTLTANVLRVGAGDEKIKDTAIVVFRHHGGSSLYSFTLRREDGAWKAIALVPTPWPHT